METKEIKITPPEGYEIDRENSTLECIKFKKKRLTYEDVVKELFKDKDTYYIDNHGNISKCYDLKKCICEFNNATSEKQLEKLLAINKLMNVAKYLNGDWKPNWSDDTCPKYYINIGRNNISYSQSVNLGVIYFSSEELAQQAIDILGEDTIRLALSTDW